MPTRIQVQSDQTQLPADGESVAHIVVQLVDQDGHPVRHIDQEVQFQVNGPIKSLGVDNGSPRNVRSYQTMSIQTHHGRALMIVQSGKAAGRGQVLVEGKDLEAGSVEIVLQ